MDSAFSSLSSFAATARYANQQRISHFRTVSERLVADRDTRALARFAAQEKAWQSLHCAAVKRSEEYRARVETAELLEQASLAAHLSGANVWYHSLRDDSSRAMKLRDSGLSYFFDTHSLHKRGTMMRRSPFLSEASRSRTEPPRQNEYLSDREILLESALRRAAPGTIAVADDFLVQGTGLKG